MSHSGTAFCTWALAPEDQGVRNAKKLAKLLKCPTKSSKDMVKCLKKVDAKKIIAQDKNFMVSMILLKTYLHCGVVYLKKAFRSCFIISWRDIIR